MNRSASTIAWHLARLPQARLTGLYLHRRSLPRTLGTRMHLRLLTCELERRSRS